MSNREEETRAYDIFADNKSLKRIPVIATFSDDGNMKPLYFSVEGIKIRVDHIVYSEKTGYGRSYRCEVTFGNRVQTLGLCYFEREYAWTLIR